jgi:hypothetical protein
VKTIRPFPVAQEDYPALRAKLAQHLSLVDMSDALSETSRALRQPVEGPCWLLPPEMWDDGKGYKKTRWKGAALYVHRVMYTIDVGPIPPGYVLDHRCRVRRCCNPSHLTPLTTLENTALGLGARTQFRTKAAYGAVVG